MWQSQWTLAASRYQIFKGFYEEKYVYWDSFKETPQDSRNIVQLTFDVFKNAWRVETDHIESVESFKNF